MRIFIPLFLLGCSLIVLSCKKERSCRCNITSSGTKTVHNQTAAVTASISIPFPGAPTLPPVQISAAKDETTMVPYYFESSSTIKYEKIRKSNIKKSCQSFEETVFENSSDVVPGSSTVTTTDQGTRKYSCSIK